MILTGKLASSTERTKLAQQPCDDAHVPQVGGGSYETDPGGIFNQGFNPGGAPIGGGCGVRSDKSSTDYSSGDDDDSDDGSISKNSTQLRC